MIGNQEHSKSKDVYELNSRIIKNVERTISKPLEIIFNECLEDFFPQQIKTSKIIYVYKKGNGEDVISYGLILIILIFIKILKNLNKK